MNWTTAWIIVVSLAVGGAAGALLAALGSRRTRRRTRELEQRAREGQRLRYVGQVTGGLMHEIKNPLSTLNLNLELMAEDLQSPTTDIERRTARKVDVLREETKRLEDTLNTFTALTGRMDLRKRRLDAGQLVSDLLTFYEPQAQQHGITLRSSIADGLPPVEADCNLLKQALLNLILNAQAAMSSGGELMVRVEACNLGVAVTVTDTGAGIAPDVAPKVFDAYYSTRRGGTGLGLPIVRRIVGEHGGTIDLASEPGRGTQIVIRLPKAAPQSDGATCE